MIATFSLLGLKAAGPVRWECALSRKETKKQKEKKGAHDRYPNTFLHNLIISQYANDRFLI
jgi:hypothetical protein